MKHIIQDAHMNEGRNCIYSTIRNIFINNMYDISETSIFFLCNGTNVWFDPSQGLNCLGYKSIEDLIGALCEVTSIGHNMKKKTDDGIFLQESAQAITEDKILMLMVNSSILTYNQVYTAYKGRGHSIFFYGIDGEKAYIGDSCIRESSGRHATFQGPIHISEVLGGTVLEGWLDFSKSKAITEADILNRAVYNLEKFQTGHSQQNDFFGRLAFEKYMDGTDILTELDDETFSGTCVDIYYRIKIVTILPMIEYMTALLNEHESLKAGNGSIMESLKHLSEEWEKFAWMSFKLSKTKKRSSLAPYLQKRQSILETQKGAFDEYISYIKKHSEN